MALAVILGVASTLPFLLVGSEWMLGIPLAAGLLAAFLVRDKGPGLGGLLLGVAGGFAVWGGYEVYEKVQSCSADGCGGLSAPTFTVLIVVGFGLIGLAAAGAGYLVGRIIRTAAGRVGALRA